METDQKDGTAFVLSEMEIDAIGEILNISMGAAATAVSSMLDKQVLITTPKVSVRTVGKLDYSSLEPGMIVKITYVKGITGSNIMVFRQKDMQFFLNQLMGIEEPPRDDFVFDELGMSAACEVMNQMMGASSTALSEFLGRSINISTPTAVIMDEENTFASTIGLDKEDNIVAIFFDLNISDFMKSEFVCILTCDLAKMIVSQFMGNEEQEEPEIPPPPAPAEYKPPVQMEEPVRDTRANPMSSMYPPENMTAAAPQMGMNQPGGLGAMGYNPQANAGPMGYNQPMNAAPGGYQTQPYGYNAAPYPQMNNPYMQPQQYPPQYPPQYPGYPPQNLQQMNPYGYPPQGMPRESKDPAENSVLKQNVNVQNVQFPVFSGQQPIFSAPLTNGNIDMLMNVPLNVSIEIGRTKKKIKDIMDFNQGSIIEIEKQAGAPVDIIVNGQLMARGDVVVIDDNFAVRITEIIGTKDLISSVEGSTK